MDTRARDQKALKILDEFKLFASGSFFTDLKAEIGNVGVRSSKLVLAYKDNRAKLCGTLKGTSPFFKTTNQTKIAEATSATNQVFLLISGCHSEGFAGALEAFAKAALDGHQILDPQGLEKAQSALLSCDALQTLETCNISDIVDEEDSNKYVA